MAGRNGKSGGSFNNKLWVRAMCVFLGVLMMLAIVFMVISAFSPDSYAETEETGEKKTSANREIGVGLCCAQSAAQSLTLKCSEGFVISAGGFSRPVTDQTLTVSADGNEYYYNKRITVNPKNDDGEPDDTKGVLLVGGYHIMISGYGVGSGDIDHDNPVYIEREQSGDQSIYYKITKEYIFEHIDNFRAAASKINELPSTVLEDVFPGCIGGKYYIMAGAFRNAEEAHQALGILCAQLTLEASVAVPDPGTVTVHNERNVILFETDSKDPLTLVSPDGAYIAAGGKMYKGCFEFCRDNTTGDTLKVVNRLDIEDYVKSRLSAEVPETASAEMLKAAAVIIRTNACVFLGKHGSDGFDVCASCHCAVYTGCGGYSDTDSVSNAVDSTAGVVLTYSDTPINALWSTSCMSTTVSAADAIGRDIPYLRSLLTNWEMEEDKVLEDWTFEISPSDLSLMLRGAGYSQITGSIKNVTVDKRSENSLYVCEMTFTDIFGNAAKITGSENIRSLFCGDLPSSAFIVSKTGKPVTFTYYAEGGVTSEITRTPEGTPGFFVFSGEGEGSGIGFSMTGAEILAKQGYSFDRILSEYYPGTALSYAGQF